MTLSATSKTALVSWLITTAVEPERRWTSRISSQSSAVRTGSRPESGSSKSRIRGRSTRARAKPARLRMPPDSSFGILVSAPDSPTSARRAMTISRISRSDFRVCWRSGNATLS